MTRLVSYIVDLYFRITFFRQVIWSLFAFTVFALAAALVFQNRRVSLNPVGWEKSYQVSPFNIAARDVSLASQGGIVIAVYDGTAGGARGIYASISFDGGGTFQPPIRVAEGRTNMAMNPRAAISTEGRMVVAWHSYVEEEATNRIYYSTSTDLGASWTASKKIDLGNDMEMLPRIYSDERNKLHLFYHGSTGDVINLYHAYSDDGEKFKTTGSLVRLTSNMRGAFFPSIYFGNGGNIFMVWQGKEEDFSDDLYFIKSSNYGSSWSSKKRITSSTGNNEAPTIILQGTTLYVVYQNNDQKNWSIKMIRGINYGGSWDEKPRDISTTMASCYSPAIGISGGDLMMLWYDTRDGRAKIFSRKYSLTDATLSAETEVSEARYESKYPTVLSQGRRFIVFWEERNVIMAKQTDIYAEPPVVYSATNPEGRWSRLPYAVVEWKPAADESGVAGYAVMTNDLPDFNPSVVNVKTNQTAQKIIDVREGVSYFHIRTVDGAGNYSRTAHYRLQISINPLTSPTIVSSTHQQGKATEIRSPAFNWAIDDTERVKGFVYNLSKDAIHAPDHFTTDFKTQFDDLDEGYYFFSVAAVDKTNQLSKVATYDFVIGPAGQVDPDYYRRIAEEQKKFQKRQIFEKEGAPPEPTVVIRFPFDERKSYDRNAFKALIVANNIKAESILGYSVYIDEKNREIPDRINMKGTILDVKDLAGGDYYIGVKCRYAGTVDGTVKYYWTRPYIAKVSIQLPAERSPVLLYAQGIIDKQPRRFALAAVTMLGLSLVITTMGFGSRIRFYARLLMFRMKVIYRLVAKK